MYVYVYIFVQIYVYVCERACVRILQAFGQPFFEELKTDESNVITIIMWPVMNLMLVNLLIAIMNDSYSEIKRNSQVCRV